MSLDNGYVSADYLQTMAEKMRAFKQKSYEHMMIAPGATLLDVGCGPGVDTIPLATLHSDAAKVIGIDTDEAMLAQAEKALQAAQCPVPVEHLPGSATDLPLDNSSVDACRAERLLQVLPPELEHPVVAELVRVTRPGGRIVLADTDWGSASVDFSDTRLERRLMNFFALKMRPNGFAGRRLYTLCRERSLDDIRVDVVPMPQQRFSDTPFGDWLVDAATAEGVMSEDEARGWCNELRRRERQQQFHACVNLIIVSGKKVISENDQ
ncbi:MAG: methyltransferase domain-containing protein [Pseudomonadota bacterium]